MLISQETAMICRDSRRMQAILRLHGISTGMYSPLANVGTGAIENESYLRKYWVHLYEHHLLGLTRVEGTGVLLHQHVASQERLPFEEVAYLPDDLEQKRVVDLAIRSIYALGINYGSVLIGVNSPSRIHVMEVNQEACSTGALSGLVQKMMDEIHAEEKRMADHTLQVMLGADPEFALRDTDGKMGIASRYLEKQGFVGYDAVRLRGQLMMDQHPLVELRPEPSHNPREVFRHILQAMRIGLKKIPDSFEWLAGGMPFSGYPIGGHIHFSGVKLSFELLRTLDSYLTLPLSLVEDEGCRKRRPRYGFLGDFREQPHGGFEYRTLPSWLISPLVTQGVLALAKLVATHHATLKERPLADWRTQKAYYLGDKEKLRPIVARLWAELEGLPLYQNYRIELDAFYRYVMTQDTWTHDQDIRIAWGLIRRERKMGSPDVQAQQPPRSMV